MYQTRIYNMYLSEEHPVIIFKFHVSNKTKDVFNQLSRMTGGYDIYSKQFNSEIVNRLAYTLIDPFYDEFIENNK